MNEKRYTLVIILTIAIVIFYYIRQTNHLSSPTDSSISISNMITKIQEIKELRCASYQDELVITKEKLQNVSGNNSGIILPNIVGKSNLFTNKIVLIIKGTTFASIDLSQLSKKDIFIQNDSLFCHLPAFSISETIINPNDIEIYSQKGDWSQIEINNIILEAKSEINKNAIQNKLIETAKKSGERQLSALFEVAGYTTIIFSYE